MRVSTGQSVVMLCGRTAHSTGGETCGWQVKLCDPSLTCFIREHFIADDLLNLSHLQKSAQV